MDDKKVAFGSKQLTVEVVRQCAKLEEEGVEARSEEPW